MRLTLISGLPALAMAAACAHGIDLEPTSDFGAGGQVTRDAAGGRDGAGVDGEHGGIAGTGGDDGFGGGAGSGGNAGFAGLAGSAGQGTGGTAGLGTTGGGGAGGTAGGGGTAGTGGAGGAGGNPDAGNGCGGNVIPVKTSWVAIAALNNNRAQLAVDADVTTRYTTSRDQAGDEWFQVDLTATTTINTVQLFTSSSNDYPAHWQVRFGESSMNFAGPVLIEGDGTEPNIVIHFPRSAMGRYLLISQTGMKTFWWSIHDLNVLCT